MLRTFSNRQWNDYYPDSAQQQAIKSLENGQILYFPELSFPLSLDEKIFLSPDFADPHAKNISYHPRKNKLWGVKQLSDAERMQLKSMLKRFSDNAFRLIKELLPRYAPHLTIERTSFRPVEISDRVTSYRKDDKRLHIDAFPATP